MVQKKEPLLCQAEVPMNKGYLVPEVPGTNEQAKSQPNVLGFLFFLLELRHSQFKNYLLHFNHSGFLLSSWSAHPSSF